MNSNTEFLNKNWYRKYPLRASSDYQDVYGTFLPLSLFAGAGLSVYLDFVDVFINKIVIQGQHINVTVASRTQTGVVALGYFDAEITQSNQVLNLNSIHPWASGHLIIGDQAALSGRAGSYIFSYTNGKIEDSLVFGYMPPKVTSFHHGTGQITGFISLALENLTTSVESNNLSFNVVDKTLTTPDFFRTVGTLSCLNPIITGINTVVPDENGNIDLYAIEPLQFDIDELAGRITLSIPDAEMRHAMCDAHEIIPALFTETAYKGYRSEGDTQRDPMVTSTPEWDDKYPGDNYVWPSREDAL